MPIPEQPNIDIDKIKSIGIGNLDSEGIDPTREDIFSVIEQQDINSPLLNTIKDFLSDPDTLNYYAEKLSKICPDITPEDIKLWFEQFQIGIKYILKKYKIIAEKIFIAESVEYKGRIYDDKITYIPDKNLDAIVVTEKFLAKAIQGIKANGICTSPHLRLKGGKYIWFFNRDYPTILGIEEASHSYYFKMQKNKPMAPGHYGDDPAEIAARQDILDGIADLKIKIMDERELGRKDNIIS